MLGDAQAGVDLALAAQDGAHREVVGDLRDVVHAQVRRARVDAEADRRQGAREALARAAIVAALVDSADGTVTLRAGADTLARRALGALHGVRIAASRDSVTYSPLGVGRGLANARYVVSRGSAAETVWVSRLGRVRTGGE